MFISYASSSNGNLYTANDGATKLIIEAGLPYPKLAAALNHDVLGHAACLLSHEHADHAAAAQELVKRGMDVWCHPATANALRIEDGAMVMLPGNTARIGTFAVTAIETRHDVPSLGYLIYSRVTGEKLLFAIDTCYLPNRFAGLTEIAVECNYSMEALMDDDVTPLSLKRRVMRTHMAVETFLGFCAANDLSRVRKIWLLHMSNDRGNAGLFARMVKEATGIPTEVC